MEQFINKVIQGDCLEVMKDIPDNSVDSIVTDPPYELGFMGKSWDNTGIANNPEMWKECLRVLKPGGHLLAFSGTRTYHRMASAIEDAGFEVRDMIEWVYGCLSEDTEILTKSGYKPLHKLTQYDKIGVYDITNNIYKWERPQRYSVYKVHQDTAYRIKSDYTDQIVSRNHRCLVEREGKLVFIQAEELNEVEYMPTLPDDFCTLQKNTDRALLLKKLLREGKGLAKKLFSKWVRKEMSEQRIEVRKEPSLERWSNLLEETRKLQADKICEVSEGVFTDGEKRWICNGTSFDSGSILGDMFRENPSSASYQSRPTGQPTGKSDVISIKQGTQIIRRARVEKIEYSGIIFCPTVSTGAFIARRNGQVFITGNSGFPKSLNIGKAVDKLQGNERESEIIKGKIFTGSNNNINGMAGEYEVTKGSSQYEGWGTALKPAHEPICMARKPLGEKTVAQNVLKYGTGGINIDESRVGAEQTVTIGRGKGGVYDIGLNNPDFTQTNIGRFPANLIHDNSEEVRECFPETKSGKMGKQHTRHTDGSPNGIYGKFDINHELGETYGDSGNASRFFKSIKKPYVYSGKEYEVEGFVKNCKPQAPSNYNDEGSPARYFKSIIYTAKASKSERNKGCEGLEEKRQNSDTQIRTYNDRCLTCGKKFVGPPEKICHCPKGLKITDKSVYTNKNNHPTVKPIALMEYLIKMVTPKGGIVLDQFAGSGSTIVAAKQNGYQYIGIELTEEYIPIINARLTQDTNPKE